MTKTLPIVLLLAALALAVQPAQADQLYRYKGSDGQWHYSDRPPAKQQGEVETLGLKTTASAPRVYLTQENEDGRATLIVVNEYHGPVQVELRFSELLNAPDDVSRRSRFVIGADEAMAVVTLFPQDPALELRYSYEMRYVLGDPEAEHTPEAPYRVPYAVASAFPISQAFGGAATHNDQANQFAVDLVMPVGTQIYAARAGTVVEVAYQHYASGIDLERDGPRANIIRILHEDGTMALYAHLDRSSARVRAGDKVQEGQYIANSGNTGFSSGPHLHFAVMRNAGLGLVSVPFQFRGAEGSAIEPRQGSVLTAYQ